jgi:hypothetical protein
MNDAIYIEQTTLLLHAFAGAVKTLGKMNLHDDNIHAEYFFCDFLNKLYGWNLGRGQGTGTCPEAKNQ